MIVYDITDTQYTNVYTCIHCSAVESQHAVLPSVEPSKEMSTEMKVPQSLPMIKQEKTKEAVGMPIII